MSLPDAARVQRAVEATWPAARTWTEDGITFRDGAGGGKRVSAATAEGAPSATALRAAAEAMRARGMQPLFCVRDGEADLDAALAAEGFVVIDPVILYAAPIGRLIDPALPRLAAIACESPLAILREIWAAGGIGPARIAVMERAPGPKRYLLGRAGDRPAGAAFVALDDEIAMVHAIEVAPARRRLGVGRALLQRSAVWAGAAGTTYLGLAVTEANAPARALYASLGMEEVGRYHYRIGPVEVGE